MEAKEGKKGKKEEAGVMMGNWPTLIVQFVNTEGKMQPMGYNWVPMQQMPMTMRSEEEVKEVKEVKEKKGETK